jgi:hypothetical protein
MLICLTALKGKLQIRMLRLILTVSLSAGAKLVSVLVADCRLLDYLMSF